MRTKLQEDDTTKKDHQLATYVTEEQYRAFSERAWRARMRVGAYLRERLEAAGELEMPTETEVPRTLDEDARQDADLLDSHYDDDALLDILAD